MAMQPHWVDRVVGENKSPKAVMEAFESSKDFQSLVAHAVKLGLEQDQANQENPRLIGSDFTQRTRAAICQGFNQNDLNLDEIT